MKFFKKTTLKPEIGLASINKNDNCRLTNGRKDSMLPSQLGR